MAKLYRSEDDAPIVESPVTDDNGQVVPAVATTEPDMPPAPQTETIADVESTREADTDTELTSYFHMEGEEAAAPAEDPSAAPEAAPAEAPMDAPAETQAADAAPAEAPAAAPAEMPAAPAEAPIADVPAAAPMVPPQPEAEVAPMVPQEGEVPPAAPVAPEVEAPTAPAEEPVADAPVQRFRQEEGEEISVVATPEPRMPAEGETDECPETGDEYVTKDIKEPINPVIEQEDDVVVDDASSDSDNAGGTEPVETGKTDDTVALEPEISEDQQEAEAEAEMLFRQAFRMEDEEAVSSDNGDQDVDVHVEVRKDDGDEHEVEGPGDTPVEQRFGFRQDGDKLPPPPKEIVVGNGPTVPGKKSNEKLPAAPPDKGSPVLEDGINNENIVDKLAGGETSDETVDNIVPDPVDPNAGNPDPEQMFSSFMQDGGSWL